MHTPLMTSYQTTPRSIIYDLDLDIEAKNSFLDFVAAGGIVFHKHTLIFSITSLCTVNKMSITVT